VRASQTHTPAAAVADLVVVGGVDPSGGAGLLRDIATAAAWGAHAWAVGTAWTEQGEGVHQVEPRPPRAVREALAHALGRTPTAVKLGMAVGPATAVAILEALARYAGPVVMDPVLASTRGGRLWEGGAREMLPLARRATLLTPNALEAAALTGRAVSTAAEAEAAGRELVEREGLAAVLVKGGHLTPADGKVIDVLVTPAEVQRFVRPWVAGANPRGTGCALATAIAIELGRDRTLTAAVASATAWLAQAIARARDVGGEHQL
jgi:hydroxymethylpyrimidine/phosphomethylpyrimidine kinase